jgi:hypothetical protein
MPGSGVSTETRAGCSVCWRTWEGGYPATQLARQSVLVSGSLTLLVDSRLLGNCKQRAFAWRNSDVYCLNQLNDNYFFCASRT